MAQVFRADFFCLFSFLDEATTVENAKPGVGIKSPNNKNGNSPPAWLCLLSTPIENRAAVTMTLHCVGS